MAVTAIKNTKSNIDSVREIVQDFLVPELKALKVDISSVRNEMGLGFASLRAEMESVRTEIRLRDEKQSQAIQALSDKLSYAIDIRERLAVLEDRSARG